MVTKLERLAVSDVALIKEIVKDRQGGKNAKFFADFEDKWKELVQSYINNGGNPEAVKPHPDISSKKDAFINLYKVPQQKNAHKPVLDELRKMREDLQLCPSCGEDGSPPTLDHYLPCSVYPEFSLTSANLVPMCSACQGAKDTKILGDHQERLFVHPYFDHFVEAQVIKIVIGRPLESPTEVRLIPHPDLKKHESELVSRHIRELGIHQRYPHFFRSEYRRLLRLVSGMRETRQDVGVRLRTFCEYARLKSINCWPHVFFSSVLEDTELVFYLESGQLPEYP